MSIAGVLAIAFDLDDTLTDWWTGIGRAADAVGAPEIRDRIREQTWLRGSMKLGLLTNNPFGLAVVERHGLDADVFDCVVVADRSIRKPDPRAFAPLMEAMVLEPGAIAYVGDSVGADVEGARGAGLLAVWIDRWNDPWPVPRGVVRVGSLSELHSGC